MTKVKVLLLCVATAILTAGVIFATVEIKIDRNPPSLDVIGPATVHPGDIPEFKAQVKNPSWFLSKTIYQWKIVGSTGEIPFKSMSEGDIFFPAGLKNDKIHVITSAVVHHNYLLWSSVTPLDIQSHCLIVGDGPVPPGPGPNPPPPPGPTPQPVSEHLYVIAVFDNTQATSLDPDQLKLHNSTTIADGVSKLNANWKNMDKANPALADASWQAVLTKVGLPALIIANDKGHVYYSAKAISEADVTAQLNKVREGK